MNVTIENLAACRKLLKVDVAPADVDAAFETVTTEVQRSIKLPGFRPGKVPREIISRNFSRELESKVREKLISDSYRKALADHPLRVVGPPEAKEESSLAKSQNFKLSITVETAPDFELPEYKGLPVQREAHAVTEADIQRAFDVLRQRGATFNDVERPAQAGDIVVVNYTGSTEGRPLTDFAPTARGLTEQKNFWMEIKEGHFIPGFTEQLTGAVKAEKRTVQVDFPADFVSEPLSGRKGVYEVEIVQVKEKILPELSDAFAVQWNAENLEKLRAGIIHDLEMELTKKNRTAIRGQIMHSLSQKVHCELPESLVASETRQNVFNIVKENQERGISPETLEEKQAEILNYATEAAREKLKMAFVLGRIAEKENIQVTREELSNYIYHMAQERQVKPEKLINDLKKADGIRKIQEQILLSKVVDFLERSAKIEDSAPPSEPANAS